MICKSCGSVRRRFEDSYSLSLSVKNQKSIYESLEKYISGEIINDYNCDSCNKRTDIVKRTLLAELPNVLIVHLQRIIFNFDTFQNEKVT